MIAIKGMEELPKNCLDCPISHEDEIDYCICGKTGKNVYLYANEIHPDCPLVEIVTCKDCKYYRNNLEHCKQWCMSITDDFYCGFAERRSKDDCVY